MLFLVGSIVYLLEFDTADDFFIADSYAGKKFISFLFEFLVKKTNKQTKKMICLLLTFSNLFEIVLNEIFLIF